jgi:hypothetical protein
MKKKILFTLIGLLMLLFGNGCYYVFHGQFRSTDKLRQGKELNAYEIGSIYTMHLAICTVGWIYSPEATKEIIGMTFKRNRNKVISKESDFFLKYPIIRDHYQNQYSRKRIAFNGDKSYSFLDKDHRLALAVNPGYLWRDSKYVYLEAPVHYPVCYNTHIGITKRFCITINECLFSYLEKKEMLHPYTLIYYAKI